MKTRVVYTLVSDAADSYLEQLMVSAYSLQSHNPSVDIVIVTDRTTCQSLTGDRANIKEFANEVVEVDTPFPTNKMLSSRYLKTNLRNLISGDYLFIDCDTIICESLDNIDYFEGDIGMVSDLNATNSLTDSNIITKCERAGFVGMEGKPYFNSGVIFARDTDMAHEFYSLWYESWKISVTNGVPNDQPALCAANIQQGYPVRELSGEWNCQFKFYGSAFLNVAKIMHYFSNTEYAQPPYSQRRIFEYVKEKGCIDSSVEKLILNPRTIFYTALTITPDKAFEFFNSEMMYYFFNVPPLYRMMCLMARRLERPLLFLSKFKTKLIR